MGVKHTALRESNRRSLSGIKRFRDETNASQARLEQRIKDLEALIREKNTTPSSAPLPILEDHAIPSATGGSLFDVSSPSTIEADDDGAMGDDEAEAAGTLEL